MSRVDDRTAAALALGVAGLFTFNIVFGPIAIALGVSAARGTTRGRRGLLVALLGVALGVADLVVLAVLVAGKVL